MMDSTAIVVAVVACFMATVALIWRQTTAWQGMFGDCARARDRERQDYQGQVQKLLEILYSPDHLKTSVQHGNERLRLSLTQEHTERMSRLPGEAVVPQPAQPDDYCDNPADAVHHQ